MNAHSGDLIAVSAVDESACPYCWWQTRRFAVVAIALAMVPLLWPAIPPLTDLPGHIGRYRVMLGTDRAILSEWYDFHWIVVGNLGVDLIVRALAPLIGLEPGVKFAVMLIPVLTVGGILWLSREIHGRVSPLALFALPLAYHYAFHFGFVNYALSMALALNGFALWLRWGRLGHTRLRAAIFVLVACIVWTAHVVGWGVLGLMVFGAEWIRIGEGRRNPAHRFLHAALACLPLMLPFAPLILWRSGGSGGLTERFFDLQVKGAALALIFRDRWAALDLGSAMLLYGLLYASLRGTLARIVAVAAAPTLLVFAAFLIMPFSLFGSAYADLRLIPYVLMIAFAGMAPRPTPSPRAIGWIAIAGCAFFGVRIIANTISLARYDRDWTQALAALDHLPRGARVMTMVGEPCADRWAHRRLDHLGGFAVARRAAFSNNQWPLTGSALMRVRDRGLGHYAHDPSQLVVDTPCDAKPDHWTQGETLRRLPRDQFTHLWMIHPYPHDPAAVAGMTMVWRSGDDILYRIDASRLAAVPDPALEAPDAGQHR